MWFLCTIHISTIKNNDWRSLEDVQPYVCSAETGQPDTQRVCFSRAARSTVRLQNVHSGTHFYTSENIALERHQSSDLRNSFSNVMP